jgi:hypothetical protein
MRAVGVQWHGAFPLQKGSPLSMSVYYGRDKEYGYNFASFPSGSNNMATIAQGN